MASPDRAAELREALVAIKDQVNQAASGRAATLLAVSKFKPASDIRVLYDNDHRDFGENYVDQLVEKAKELPSDIRWHFIGAIQSKWKDLARIPNIYAIQTVTSVKAATKLNEFLPAERTTPLNVLLQVNTSGEDVKAGLAPLASTEEAPASTLAQLAVHIVTKCPRLRLQGIMTIGSLTESLRADGLNADFETLKQTGAVLELVIRAQGKCADGSFEGGHGDTQVHPWGQDGRLLLSMGMSNDYVTALKAGSDIVRVGTAIFGERHKKGES
ncbi:hypothetical protein BV22DRAFT_1059376 [Leucogyrophana mollusca]|uniref:Uncharacterized protein n=1 Tax=Leucogyrophana mollusca TaxID=85980 RepID=A0ACB8BQT8_9AGAM|nr:hypothetical protein BV22DRAFT_1059376 [Leucogyrophana mollusca]